MDLKQNKIFIQRWLLLLGASIAWYLYDSIHVRNIWFLAMAGLGVLVLVALLLTITIEPKKEIVLRLKGSPKVLAGICLAVILLVSVLFFTLHFGFLSYGAGRMVVAVFVAGLAAMVLQANDQSHSIYLQFAFLLLSFGVLHRAFAFVNEISPSAFSLGWSEGSRYYNASLFASRQLYGQKLPLPVLHPSRYLMQAVPFFVGIRDILVHRIWQVLLWLGMTLWTSIVLAKRVKNGLKLPVFWVTLYFFLFFFQGAVYYHMMVCVLLVLYGYKKDKPWITLIFVVLASVWAGISRVNWMPLPALLAVLIYLIEEPLTEKKWVAYLRWPFIWILLGLAAAWISKKAYIGLSGELASNFDSAFSSALLWERLIPNKTFFLGILPGILLLCWPLLELLLHRLDGKWKQVHWLRWFGMAAILGAFFAGGVVVSVKIGGGGDLHNLDAFIFLWAVFAAYLLSGKLELEDAVAQEDYIQAEPIWKTKPFWLAVAVIVPVFFAFMRAGTWQFKTDEHQKAELSILKTDLEALQHQPGDILFISERQLLVFDELKDISMVADYEKVFLMEMAMGGNKTYLSEFYSKLSKHHYKAIVIDSISTNIQDSSRPFNEENNAWVQEVLVPILMFYRPEASYRGGEVNLLVPNAEKIFQDL